MCAVQVQAQDRVVRRLLQACLQPSIFIRRHSEQDRLYFKIIWHQEMGQLNVLQHVD